MSKTNEGNNNINLKFKEVINGRYHCIKKIGEGYTSEVWLMRDTIKNRYVAMKILGSKYIEYGLRENKILKYISNKNLNEKKLNENIISYYDSFLHNDNYCIIMELMGPNILTIIKEYHFKGIPVRIVKRIIQQVLIGLQFIHDKCDYIHGDIKPENICITMSSSEIEEYGKRIEIEESAIFSNISSNISSDISSDISSNISSDISIYNLSDSSIDNSIIYYKKLFEKYMNINIKIADFGISCIKEHINSIHIQTIEYRAYEVVLKYNKYNEKIDIWSVACLMYELFNGSYLFDVKCTKNKQYSHEKYHLILINELLGEKIMSNVHMYDNIEIADFEIKKYRGLNSIMKEKYYNNNLFILFTNMLCPNMNERLSAMECLQSIWFM